MPRLAALAALALLIAPAVAAAGDGPDGVCRTDRYFVHVPTFADPSMVPAGFGRQLRQTLASVIPVDRDGPRFTVTDVRPVLPGRRVDQRVDGRRRFWQVRLDRPLDPAEACRFVGVLRSVAYAQSPDTTFYVGRECGAVGHGAPADPLSPDWHHGVMGRPAPLADDQIPAEVAIVDTGVFAPSDFEADPDFDLDRHRHGAAMADLVSQIDPEIPLRDYRALDANGHGDLADVARAIDAAVFQAEGPRVINLSLGWPPELERTRQLDGGQCSTTEDPAGEAVRYALAMARLRDGGLLTVGGQPRPHNGPTAVVAAAGNRISPFMIDPSFFFEKLLGAVDEAPNPDPCSAPGDDDLFYPAQWSRRVTCMQLAGTEYTFDDMVIAAGASDHRDRAGNLSLPVPIPPLVAPGAHVLAAGERWTGSSVSAALVSGALSLAFARGAADADAAFAAVHAAGADLSALGTGVRRLAFEVPYAPTPAAPAGDFPTLVDGAGATTWTDFEMAVCLIVLLQWADDDSDFATVKSVCPPFLHTLDQYTAGRAGPQPPDVGCPDCPAHLFVQQGDLVDVQVALNHTWDPATDIAKPYLYAEWADGAFTWIALPGNGQLWQPGSQFTIKGLTVAHPNGTLSLADLEAKGKMQLHLQVQTPKQAQPTNDVSDLVMTPL